MGDIDVVILIGGQGSRLREVVSDRPKPMAEINGIPFLDILINYYLGFGFKRFIMCVGYMADFIESYYKEKRCDGLEMLFSREDALLGTGGAVKNAEKLINNDSFFVLNGDSFCPVDLTRFVHFHTLKRALLSMALAETDAPADFGQIILDESGRVTQFKEKSGGNSSSFINAGIYLFDKKILSIIPPGRKYSLEYDLFPTLIGKEFYGFVTGERLLDIGTPERYETAKRFFAR